VLFGWFSGFNGWYLFLLVVLWICLGEMYVFVVHFGCEFGCLCLFGVVVLGVVGVGVVDFFVLDGEGFVVFDDCEFVVVVVWFEKFVWLNVGGIVLGVGDL